MADEARAEDERSLTARAQAGDISAFEELVARHKDRVYGVALRIVRSEADAAEITQEAFLSAYQHLLELRGDAAFGTWVHRIAANLSVSRLRHLKVAGETETPLEEPEFTDHGLLAHYPQRDWSKGAEERALDNELRGAIRQAVDRLPSGYREVFLLKDVEGLSYEEIAEMTGDSVPAIKSRLHRARVALRAAIDRFYNES
ncbi:MAG: sigma-70 family RNA polymerase sigma factor [Myxococcales bacterium]|nr:sigma-70 family RNA polymerase sigma factor [Myxococcales bacterium]